MDDTHIKKEAWPSPTPPTLTLHSCRKAPTMELLRAPCSSSKYIVGKAARATGFKDLLGTLHKILDHGGQDNFKLPPDMFFLSINVPAEVSALQGLWRLQIFQAGRMDPKKRFRTCQFGGLLLCKENSFHQTKLFCDISIIVHA